MKEESLRKGFSEIGIKSILLEGLDEFSESYPQEGILQDGQCFPLRKSGLCTNEKDGGYLPTPKARDWKDCGSKEAQQRQMQKRDYPSLAVVVGAQSGGSLNPSWVEWLMGYQTEWTALSAWAMQWFRSRQGRRSKC